MTIHQDYLKILESEQIDEGFLKNAAMAATLAGAGLMANHISHDKPVENPIHHMDVQRAGGVISKDSMASSISSRYKIDRSTANEIVDAAHRHAAPNGAFPQAHHLLALAGVESSMHPFAKSKLRHDPAIGLTQIRPKATGIHKTELASIDGQMKHTSQILQKLHSKFGNPSDAFASYNVGVTAHLQGRTNHNYAPKIFAELKHYVS
jgi:Transglycosylase SLT domain